MNDAGTTGKGAVPGRIAAFVLILSLLAAAAVPQLAAAAEAAPEAAPVYETSPYEPEPMVVTFTAKTAKIAGPGAIVSVRCAGSASGSCDGTLSLRLGGAAHKVPYTIAAGETRIVVVPLGEVSGRRGGGAARTAAAVTRTMQPLGGLVRSSRQLRLR